MASVLIIDDSSFQRRMIRSILKQAGHRTAEAGDGAAGLEALGRELPDLVLCDLLMDGVGGLEFLAAVRDRELAVPVIIITADIQDSVHEQCRELGARAIVAKPPKRDQLLEAVAGVLARRPRRTRRKSRN